MKKLSSVRSNAAALAAFFCVASMCALEAGECSPVCSPEGTHVATATEQGRIDYRKTIDNSVQGTFYICHPRAISFSENGMLLAAAGGGNGSQAKIKVWHLGEHQQLCEIVTTGSDIHTLALSPDGRLVLGVSSDQRVEVWRVADGQSQWSHAVAGVGTLKSIRFSPDSKRLLLQTEDGERQFDAGNGRALTGRGY